MKISLAAKLENSSIEFIFIILIFEDFDALDNVWMVKFSNDIHFFFYIGGVVVSKGFEDLNGKNFFG